MAPPLLLTRQSSILGFLFGALLAELQEGEDLDFAIRQQPGPTAVVNIWRGKRRQTKIWDINGLMHQSEHDRFSLVNRQVEDLFIRFRKRTQGA